VVLTVVPIRKEVRMSERKLASVRRINHIRPIEGADKIEVVSVDGWDVVCQKGKHEIGEKVVLFEVDSFLPEREEFEFLRKSCYKQTENLGNGFRLRTVKLRKQLSQGLVMSLEELGVDPGTPEGWDLTQSIGVKKWELPIPTNLRGEINGFFPDFIPKTDQERVQNILLEVFKDDVYETTLKLDGSSMTVYLHPETGELGVCSRNLDLKVNDKNMEGNTFVKTAMELSLGWKLREANDMTGCNLAFQGELVGPGIQKNACGLTSCKFYIFDIYDIDNQRYMSPMFRRALCIDLGLDHVPVLNDEQQIGHLTKANLLEMADSLPVPFVQGELNIRKPEGIVFKSITDSNVSFKVISNKFLIANGD